MKVRKDFVTNSSSSSFLIAKKYLDDDQIEAIKNHSTLGEKLGFDCCDWAWEIDENEDFITGYTVLDNFDMDSFLEKIDVDDKDVNWSEYPFNLPDLSEENTDEKIEDDEPDWRKLLHEN